MHPRHLTKQILQRLHEEKFAANSAYLSKCVTVEFGMPEHVCVCVCVRVGRTWNVDHIWWEIIARKSPFALNSDATGTC